MGSVDDGMERIREWYDNAVIALDVLYEAATEGNDEARDGLQQYSNELVQRAGRVSDGLSERR